MKAIKIVKDSATFTLNEVDLTGMEVDEVILTPKRDVPYSDGLRWWLDYSPAGWEEENKGHVSVFLWVNKNVKVKYTFTVDGSSIKKSDTKIFSSTPEGDGFPKYASHEDLRNLFRDGKLTITCTAEFFIEVPFALRSPRLHLCCEHIPTDCELVMGKDRLQVHKYMLCLLSPVFNAMFFHDTVEAKTAKVVITDFSYAAVKAAIGYCYGRDIEDSVDTYIDVLRFADKYAINDVISHLGPIPMCNMSTANFCSIVHYAYDYSNEEYLNECCEFYKNNEHEIKVSTKFTNLPPTLVVHVLQTAFDLKTNADVLHHAFKTGTFFIVEYLENLLIESMTLEDFCPAVSYAWENAHDDLKKACAMFVNENYGQVLGLNLSDKLSCESLHGVLKLGNDLKHVA